MTDAEERTERETRKEQVEALLRQLETTSQMLQAYYQTLGQGE